MIEDSKISPLLQEDNKQTEHSSTQEKEGETGLRTTSYLIIEGETLSGGKFRPSDWCDRLYSTLDALDEDEFEDIKDLVHLVSFEGKRCILVNLALEEQSSLVYRFFTNFAQDNSLKTISISEEEWEKLHRF